MSKYERRIYFERLLELRESYHRTDHSAGDLTVAQAIAYAETLLGDTKALDAILGAESYDSPNDSTAQSSKAA
jgi:hypothetical protein